MQSIPELWQSLRVFRIQKIRHQVFLEVGTVPDHTLPSFWLVEAVAPRKIQLNPVKSEADPNTVGEKLS